MTINMNLDGVEPWAAGEILPPGEHVCRIDSAEESTSSGGHPQFELEMRCTAGDYVGGSIRDWIVITSATLGKVRQLLEATGLQIPSGAFAFDASSLRGRGVKILVREEPTQDGTGTRSRVKAYMAASGDNGFAAPAGVIGAASSQLPLGGASSSAQQHDDDIPF
jgi:hypothetical protein